MHTWLQDYNIEGEGFLYHYKVCCLMMDIAQTLHESLSVAIRANAICNCSNSIIFVTFVSK